MVFRRVLRLHKAAHHGHPVTPERAQRLQLLVLFMVRLRQSLAQAAPSVGIGRHFSQQRLHIGQERIHAGPNRQHLRQRVGRQAVALLAPVILHGLGEQGFFVGHQLLFKQAGAVKSVLAQHALAPGVNGVDAGVVHALSGHGQAPGGLLARGRVGVIGQQVLQVVVGLVRHSLAAKTPGGLQQARSDAVGQLPRGGAGEGHHQNVGRHQGPGKARLGRAVAQHQAHVQRGNRPGFAGTGAGFNQARAPQREASGVQCFGHGRFRRQGRALRHRRWPWFLLWFLLWL